MATWWSTAAILPSTKECGMTLTDLCLILGVLFAFGSLLLKIIEVVRHR